MKWITSTHLVAWANTDACEGILPELIKKLIIGSASKFPEISFPSNDSIYKPGWDGLTITEEACKFVPEGVARWEVGRNDDYKRKCNQEYNKRTRETKIKERRKSTFVFVTPRRWVKAPLKDKWIAEKLKKNEWKDIKVYDADDLELWLEQTPAIGAWLAKELKLFSGDVVSALDYWQKFRHIHKLTPDVVISGRTKESSQIVKFLSGNYAAKEVQSSSRPEAITFIIASAISSSEIAQQSFFARSIIVSNMESLRAVVAQHAGLNIIYDSQKDDSLSDYDAGQNHLLCPVSFKVQSHGITIPTPRSHDFIKSLESIGYNFREASNLSKQTGRSFSVLARILSNSPGRVQWSEGKNELELLPIFFAGKMDDRMVGDRIIIGELSNQGVDLYLEKLKGWSLISDAPVYQVANYWRTVSPYDLLHTLSKYINESHLRQFREVFKKVLTEINPALELEPKLRAAASLFGKQTIYSDRLKDGLCQTLVLLAVQGGAAEINVGFEISLWVDSIVKDILSSDKIDFWKSIENKLHLLAEASPDSFLQRVEELADKEPAIIGSMFQMDNFDLFTPTYYLHMLWAIEALAWDPRYISRAALTLAKLASLDTGIKTVNKPINSLIYIFLPRFPQTYASASEREEVLELLINRNAPLAFRLLKEISPRIHTVGMHSHKPIYRLRNLTEVKVKSDELSRMNSFICAKLQFMAANNCEKWAEIIALVDHFEYRDTEMLINSLTSITDFEGDLNLLRASLQSFIRHREEFGDESLSGSQLQKLRSYYDSLISSEIDKYYWYFNVDTIDRYGATDTYEKLIEKTTEKRKYAVSAILDEDGFEGILELTKRVEKPSIVGYVLAEVKGEFDAEMINYLDSNDANLNLMASSYFYRSSILRNADWLKEKASEVRQKGISKLASFFLSVEPTSSNWDLLQSLSEEANSIYWKRVSINPFAFKNKTDDFHRCLKTLHTFKRFVLSVNMITHNKEIVPADLIVAALEGLVTGNEPEGGLHLGSYAIHELFKQLDNAEIAQEKMEVLEWYYLDVLNDSPHTRPVRYLNKALERPDFFAQILSWIYRPQNTELPEIPEAEKGSLISRARNADHLLDSWDRLPGERQDHSIDADILKSWMSKVIIECRQLDRENSAYHAIGKLFGIAHERGRFWPQPELCSIIEETTNREIDAGFITGCINGSRVRASLRPSGSTPEKTQEKHYRQLSLRLANRFPTVSRLLNEVANHYERWAKHMDTDDAQRHLED